MNHDLCLSRRLFVAGSLASPLLMFPPEKPFGTHAFTLTGPDADPRHLKWLAIGLAAGTNAVALSALLATETMNRVSLAPETAQRVSSLMHPGSTLVITDQPSHQDTRTGPGFTIITHDT